MAWSKEKRRAYNKAYQIKRADYFKAYAESHKTQRNARLRARRALDPVMRAAERVVSERYKSKRKLKQWELTLVDGMKQYMLAYTENDAITKWCKYVSGKRSLVAGVKEYDSALK